jgi:hypothetical protein
MRKRNEGTMILQMAKIDQLKHFCGILCDLNGKLWNFDVIIFLTPEKNTSVDHEKYILLGKGRACAFDVNGIWLVAINIFLIDFTQLNLSEK